MIHVVIHFPLELMHSLCNFIHTFEEKIPQKGAYPLPIQISNDCIYTCWANINQLLGDAVLVIFISNSEILKKYINLDLYNDPLYLAHLRS